MRAMAIEEHGSRKAFWHKVQNTRGDLLLSRRRRWRRCGLVQK